MRVRHKGRKRRGSSESPMADNWAISRAERQQARVLVTRLKIPTLAILWRSMYIGLLWAS